MKEFTIKVSMNERWIPHFCSMLRQMQRLGSMGSSRKVGLYADGDGDFNPKFEFSIDFEEVDPVLDSNGDFLYDAG